MISPRTWLALGALLSLSSPGWSTEQQAERFAIVIGNNRPDKDDETRLRYADDDAISTHRLLLEAGVRSVLLTRLDQDSRILHGNVSVAGPPRHANLQRAFDELATRMRAAGKRGQTTELMLFYSGHGDVARGEGYVVLEDRRLTRTALFGILSRSPASRNHVFVDACKSYFLVFDRGPGGRRTPYQGPGIAKDLPAHLDDTGFVLSTSSDRDSHEWERYQGGILSHELRSALRGAADVNLDGRIDYAELGAFLTAANRSIPNPRFRPDFMVRPPKRNFRQVVLAWPNKAASLWFDQRRWGHFYVETARGERVLDAHPAPGQALALRVPNERPLFVRQNDEQIEYTVTIPGRVNVAELSRGTPNLASRGALNLALARLFESPFSESDVQRYLSIASQSDPAAEQGALERPARRRVRKVTGGLAIASEVIALALNGTAAYLYFTGNNSSQQQTELTNERVQTLNRASLPFHASAALAGIGWALITWWPQPSVNAWPVSASQAGGVLLDVQGTF